MATTLPPENDPPESNQPERDSVVSTETRPEAAIRFRAILVGFLLCVPVNYAVASLVQSSIFSLMAPPMSATFSDSISLRL